MSFTEYKNINVFHYFPQWNNGVGGSLNTELYTTGTSYGYTYAESFLPESYYKTSYTYVLNGKDKISEFIELFDDNRGRYGNIWFPSWNDDFKLTADIGSSDTQITVATIDSIYDDAYPVTRGSGRHILIYLKDAKWFARKITGYSANSLTLDSALGEDINKDHVKMVCFLYMGRLDIDTLEFEYITPDVAQTTIHFIELTNEYTTTTTTTTASSTSTTLSATSTSSSTSSTSSTTTSTHTSTTSSSSTTTSSDTTTTTSSSSTSTSSSTVSTTSSSSSSTSTTTTSSTTTSTASTTSSTTTSTMTTTTSSTTTSSFSTTTSSSTTSTTTSTMTTTSSFSTTSTSSSSSTTTTEFIGTHTWDTVNSDAGYTYSNGNRTCYNTSNAWKAAIGNWSKTSGKWYWEFEVDDAIGYQHVGICGSGVSPYWSVFKVSDTSGKKYKDGAFVNLEGETMWIDGDIVQVALDMDNCKWWYGLNGTWHGSGDPSAGTNPIHSDAEIDDQAIFPFISTYDIGNKWTACFELAQQTYSAPNGFYAPNEATTSSSTTTSTHSTTTSTHSTTTSTHSSTTTTSTHSTTTSTHSTTTSTSTQSTTSTHSTSTTTTTVAAGAWLGTWAKRIQIDIDNTKIDSGLSSFPVLIHLSTTSGISDDDVSAVFDELTSDANRKKIAVTTSDAETQCYVEIEKWDDANEEAWLWVKVPTVSDSEDTTLYFYYDSSESDNTSYVGDRGDTPAQAVWSSFELRYDMVDGTTSTVLDSTGNGHTGAKAGADTPAEETSLIADGQDFTSGDYIDIPDAPTDYFAGSWTVEMMIKDTNNGGVFLNAGGGNSNWNTTDGNYFLFYEHPTYDEYYGFFNKSGTGTALDGNQALGDSSWRHVAVSWDGTNIRIFVNGTQKDSDTGLTKPTTCNLFRLGMVVYDTANQYTGDMDEVRVATSALSAAWLKATYYSNMDNLVEFGTEETS